VRPRAAASAAAALALGLAAAVAGCGSETGQPPEAVARAFVSTNEPSKCGLVTSGLLEEQTGRRGADARRFCEANVRREPRPADVRVIEAEIMGGKATVEMVVDNREERLQLVRVDGRWRIFATGR